jgi:surface-adhesin protein E
MDRWAFVGIARDTSSAVAIDTTHIMLLGQSRYDLWLKFVYLRADSAATAKWGAPPAYSLARTQLDCHMLRNRQVAWLTYDSSGNVLNSFAYPEAQWSDIIPGSMGEAWAARECALARTRAKR